jgi:hypothetical protein
MGKPQTTLSRAYYSTSADANLGRLAGHAAAREARQHHDPARPNLAWGPPPAARWPRGATAVPENAAALRFDPMTSEAIKGFGGGGEGDDGGGPQSVRIEPHCVWPCDKAVIRVSAADEAAVREHAAVWNETQVAGADAVPGSRRVLTHGSVVLVADAAGEAAYDPKPKFPAAPTKLCSAALMADAAAVRRALAGGGAGGRPRRYLVLAGGAMSAAKAASDMPHFGELARGLGAGLARRWPELPAAGFAGVLTRSRVGFCDTVKLEEKARRGFSEAFGGVGTGPTPPPMFHLKDLNAVALDGDALALPHGTPLLLSNGGPGWADDFCGANRGALLALLAADGLVLLGGQGDRDMRDDVAALLLAAHSPPSLAIIASAATPGVFQFDRGQAAAAMRNLGDRKSLDRENTFADVAGHTASWDAWRRACPRSSASTGSSCRWPRARAWRMARARSGSAPPRTPTR